MINFMSWIFTLGKADQASLIKIKLVTLMGHLFSGNEHEKYMVLEISTAEFDNSSIHRYSVIPHEYFHTYQMLLSENLYN